MKNLLPNFIVSISLAIIFFAVGSNISHVACTITPPGGINEGWRGLPIPYYSCGVWGEQFSPLIAVLDIVLLTIASYFLVRFLQRFNR